MLDVHVVYGHVTYVRHLWWIQLFPLIILSWLMVLLTEDDLYRRNALVTVPKNEHCALYWVAAYQELCSVLNKMLSDGRCVLNIEDGE